MTQVIRVCLIILEKYGMDALQLGVIFYLFWKLFSNHLKHIIEKLDSNIKETKCVKREVINLKERVAKVEGRLEFTKCNTTIKRKKR